MINSAVGDVDWNEEMYIPDDDVVFAVAAEEYGLASQATVAIEELGELIVALSHMLRNREGWKEETIEELADGLVVINNIIAALGVDIQVEEVYNKKVERLWRRMNRE